MEGAILALAILIVLAATAIGINFVHKKFSLRGFFMAVTLCAAALAIAGYIIRLVTVD